ncbi:BREX-2 system adenine-specific DNA-methyltransferase PglX [Gimesia sp.]|uniref:BREX-2 system adenine-specific DNA-methyltransferase PglX n=1 Tax=Gimesia sp. TaxID=2024833 RepID=UPI0025B82F75|nr:BREX-2 system adenine-specific DNA-methyltransferase PglX [Gimesia sp.]|tara:strand:- start:2030 stop:3040 length:1011 start_codon:yes stop_codon:yes gene_type:complete
MINRSELLSDLQSLLRKLEADLLVRTSSVEVPEVGEWLRAEYQKAKDAERTALTYKRWLDDFITQVAAAWVLSCVFARFMEDNELIDPPRLAGPGKRLEQARDEHTLFFQDPEHAKLTDREYLLDLFEGLAQLPAGQDLFGSHNPMNALPNWLGPDAAGELLRFFQKIDSDTGVLLHDFTDPEWDTRFLGDLYQDLSEAARKKYALLQTPDFVEEFILDRTLDPALDEFGLDAPPVKGRDGKELAPAGFRMIDPACGSGHFLLGSFPRILDRWQKKDPGANVRDLVQRTLNSIHGVDINPFAIAIARFRLLLAALKACHITQLSDAPEFELNPGLR